MTLHKISLVYLICGVLFTTGCMKLKKKGEEEKSPLVETEVASQSIEVQKLDFDYEIDEGVQKVRFQIPNSWPESVVVEKTVGTEKASLREIAMTKQTWKDILSSESKTSYKFFEKTEKDLKLIEQVDVIPVLDFDLESEVHLEDLFGSLALVRKIRIQNLEMSSSAKLYISDFKGYLQLDRVISDKGTIQTFPEGARAKQGDGRSVGDFTIRILDGSGELNLYAVAEAGANGANGAPPDLKLKGGDGLDGAPATFTHTRSGSCGAGIDQMCIIPAQIFDCTKPPADGGPAIDGHQGYPGEPGKNGGSVKKFAVENLNPTVLVNIYKRAGKKGAGGYGGIGGDPGNPGHGGDGGQKDFYRFFGVNPADPKSMAKVIGFVMGNTCPPASAGRSGSRGPQGNPGSDGEDGMIF